MNHDIETLCTAKEQELLERYFGNLTHEASIERPETIGHYTQDLPMRIAAEFREYLEGLWDKTEFAPRPMILDESKLLQLITEDDRECIESAHRDASRRTLWERITRSNHSDVTHYKALLLEYTRDILSIMRLDFLEEITGIHINCKAFPED